MKELSYQEIPTRHQGEVVQWLHQLAIPLLSAEKHLTPTGCRWQNHEQTQVLVVFTWSVLNTTYLKIFQWSEQAFPGQQAWLDQFTQAIQQHFPPSYPPLPAIDGSAASIFEALEPHYPLTVRYFRRIPNGERDLERVYWWEQRWRTEAQAGSLPRQPVIFRQPPPPESAHPQDPLWDVVVVGGALGSLQAAALAQLGYRVALVERLSFGRMNREWNISRRELATLTRMGLLTSSQVESLILREYQDGFNKFFDGNSPVKAPVLHTPTVLNIAIDAEKLLNLCGEKILAAGGKIFDQTEFQSAYLSDAEITLQLQPRTAGSPPFYLRSRLLVDAMGTASPVAQQLANYRAFDSVCPTVGAVIQGGFEPGVWDSSVGDILASHGDISRGRQLIWELFPGPGQELTFYLFHYHQVNPQNPGSLLEMYEDFFTILPEYRRCDLDQLQWKKATFGYIPGRFGLPTAQPQHSMDRVWLVGDAAAMQSPLSFTGFGALVRNSPRLVDLLDTALRHDLLTAADLHRVRADQGNSAVTWLFSRGMMVPTGQTMPPARINAMLNSFFAILGQESPEAVDNFIKDRASWSDFSRMAWRAAQQNPQILVWIWQSVGWRGIAAWLPTYFRFTLTALLAYLLEGWLPRLAGSLRPWLEARYPRLWHRLLAWCYRLGYNSGQSTFNFTLPAQKPVASEGSVDPPRSEPLEMGSL
ncbi:MAG: flavin-dependent dehydrogenase [Cyanobacteriota bacterium]|nr:flavin-dependent dehydrogenase [Cyanobacteriota bacterium]